MNSPAEAVWDRPVRIEPPSFAGLRYLDRFNKNANGKNQFGVLFLRLLSQFTKNEEGTMSQHDASRREFVTSLGLGIAGLSIADNARADGNFDSDQGDSCTSRATTCSPWDAFEPKPIHEHTLDYGFVVKHPAYWGLPIPGFGLNPNPI